jgi:hypothetical protein
MWTEMKYFKKNTKNDHIDAVLLLTVAITATSVLATTTSLSSFPITSSIAIPAASATPATTTGNATNTTTTTTTASQPELSPQPIYEERSPPGDITPINETHGIFTFSGNGMLTLPNTTETINTTHNGTAVASFTTTSAQGKETIRTEDGEIATVTLYEIVQFSNPALGVEGKGIVTAVFHTDSTGVLAPLNGTIAVGVDEISPTGESHITLWKWESGIPLSTGSTATAEDSPPMETPTATDVTADDNTAATAPVGEEEEQQTTTTIPAPTPLLE